MVVEKPPKQKDVYIVFNECSKYSIEKENRKWFCKHLLFSQQFLGKIVSSKPLTKESKRSLIILYQVNVDKYNVAEMAIH